MSCNNCTEAKSIPMCAENLYLGTVTVSDPVYVFIKNNANGFIYSQEVTPGYANGITLDLTLPYPNFYSPNFYYTLTVSETPDGNDEIPLTVDGEDYDCLTIKFKKIFNDNDLIESLTDVNLTI